MQHPSLSAWEDTLKKVLDHLDDTLEDQFGNHYKLHPARPERGRTSNKSHDGLFDITANFTLGLGSERGKGYVIDIHLSTLEKIPGDIWNQIEDLAVQKLRNTLKEHFPDKSLHVDRDGKIIKIYGDLSLGRV